MRVLITIVAMTLSGCAAKAVIGGQVLGLTTEKPLAGVTITCVDVHGAEETVFTDGQGRFEFQLKADGIGLMKLSFYFNEDKEVYPLVFAENGKRTRVDIKLAHTMSGTIEHRNEFHPDPEE